MYNKNKLDIMCMYMYLYKAFTVHECGTCIGGLCISLVSAKLM